MSIPTAITQPAKRLIGKGKVRLNGKVSDDGGEACDVRFRWREKALHTLTVQPSSKDNHVRESAKTTNEGTGTSFVLYNRTDYVIRPLVSFSLDGLPDNITVNASTLSLYMWEITNPVSGRVAWAYKLTRDDWHETQSTWNIYKTGSNWATAGGDYVTSSPSGGSVTLPISVGWVSWNVKAIVEDACDNNLSANFLLRFENEAEANYNIHYFYSREYATNTTLCPKLVIEYTEPWTTSDWDETGYSTDDTFYHDLTDLDHSTEYEFQVQARNTDGEGDWSASAYFTPTVVGSFPTFFR